jgi:hypothetical protein
MKVIKISTGIFAVTTNSKGDTYFLASEGTEDHAIRFLQIRKALAHIEAAEKLLKKIGVGKESMTIGHRALDLVDTFDSHYGNSNWRA